MSGIISGIMFLQFVIYCGLGVVLIFKHSEFPDLRVGYHIKTAGKNRESWDYANRTAGVTSLLASLLSLVFAFVFLFGNLHKSLAVTLVFAVSVFSVFLTLFVPYFLLQKKQISK